MSKLSTENDDEISKIQNEAKSLFGEHLKVAISSISPALLKEMVELEKKAKEAASKTVNNYNSIIDIINDSLISELSKGDFSVKTKDEIKSLFTNSVIKGLSEIPKQLTSNLTNSSGLLFNEKFTKTTVDVLEGILNFKNSIDEKFPGLSDTILSLSKIAITLALSTVVPPVVLPFLIGPGDTGIISNVIDFFKTDNLKKSIDGLKGALDEVEKNKHLKEALSDAKSLVAVSEETKVSVGDLHKIGIKKLSKETIQQLLEDQSIKELLKIINDYEKDYKKDASPGEADKTNYESKSSTPESKPKTKLKEESKKSFGTIETLKAIKDLIKNPNTSSFVKQNLGKEVISHLERLQTNRTEKKPGTGPSVK